MAVLERFGQGSVQRRAVADRLKRLYQLAASTGQLARFAVFGSFVTAKDEPNDVDVVVLMEDTFDLVSVKGEAALVFQHAEADAHFGASVFWARRSGRLWVKVTHRRSGASAKITATPANALSVFYHPFAYAGEAA